jgi:hypothetical protein
MLLSEDNLVVLLEIPEKLEREFLWLRAAAEYQKLHLPTTTRNGEIRGEVLERIGYATFRAAMQSNDKMEFRERIRQAITEYKRAVSFYREFKLKREPFLFRSKAMEAYLRYWLADKSSAKRRSIDKSWRLARGALRGFKKTGNGLEFAKTYDQLSVTAAISFNLDWDFRVRRQKLRDAIDYGRLATRMIPHEQDKELLAKMYTQTALFIDASGDEICTPEEFEPYHREALEYWKKAKELDENIALETARPPPGFYRILDYSESAQVWEAALVIARRRRDNFAIGWSLDALSNVAFWKAQGAEDSRQRVRLAKESLGLAEAAAEKFAVIGFTTPNFGVLWASSPYAEHFLQLSWFEADSKRIRNLVRKSLSEVPELLRLTRLSMYPMALQYGYHLASKVKSAAAMGETNRRRKRDLIQQALRERVRSGQIVHAVRPKSYWDQAVNLRATADMRADLAALESDAKARALLREAVKEKERGLRLRVKYVESIAKGDGHPLFGTVSLTYAEYGDLLTRLYRLDHDLRYLRDAAKAYGEAIRWCKRHTRVSPLAEYYWKAALTYDGLQAYSGASDNFQLAAQTYETTSVKVPDLNWFYLEYANYLKAWSMIEQARSYHRQMRYDKAGEHYEQSANLHRLTKRWNFLSPHYFALAKLELAEHSSKIGQSSRAVLEFEEATRLFKESAVSLRDQLASLEQPDQRARIGTPDERAMLESLVEPLQGEYCNARMLIEEARVAESQGDQNTSSEKFRVAAEKLEGIATASRSEAERREVLFIASLSKAWSLMAKARTEGTRGTLQAACNIFTGLQKIGPDENARTLAAGHAHFCKAIMASNMFADSFELDNYDTAAKHFTIATNHFLTSGFAISSEQARACKLLLDAHAQIALGGRDPNPDSKAARYNQARTLLREAADAFEKAQQSSRREEVLRLLRKVEEEWTLSSHLAEISRVVTFTSVNAILPTSAHDGEKPIGLARLDRADVEAKLTTTSKRSHLGVDLELEIEVANIGNQTVRLERIDGLTPSGVELVQAPEASKLVNGALVLKDGKLDSSKLERFRIVLRPHEGETVLVEPRIHFFDEKGGSLHHGLSPKILLTSPILDFLLKAYLDDHGGKMLAPSHSGWRTYMEIVNALKIPRSHLYGEPRYGHRHGKPLETLLGSGLVDLRIFPGERGRGGKIAKVRVANDHPAVKEYLREMSNLSS